MPTSKGKPLLSDHAPYLGEVVPTMFAPALGDLDVFWNRALSDWRARGERTRQEPELKCPIYVSVPSILYARLYCGRCPPNLDEIEEWLEEN